MKPALETPCTALAAKRAGEPVQRGFFIGVARDVQRAVTRWLQVHDPFRQRYGLLALGAFHVQQLRGRIDGELDALAGSGIGFLPILET